MCPRDHTINDFHEIAEGENRECFTEIFSFGNE